MKRLSETREERETRLLNARLAYRAQVSWWAKALEDLSYCEGQDGMTEQEAIALQVASIVLRDSKSTPIKRAQREVMKARKR